MGGASSPYQKGNKPRSSRSCMFCRAAHIPCKEHPGGDEDDHLESCNNCVKDFYLCPLHDKCKRCLKNGLRCGPYETAQETTSYLQRQQQRPTVPMLIQNFTDPNIDVAQSPYLGAAPQSDRVPAPLPASQGSASNTVRADDRPPAVSFDMQDPLHHTGPGLIDPRVDSTDDFHQRAAPTEHSRDEASWLEDHDSDIISPFDDHERLHTVQEYVATESRVLQIQGLDGAVYHPIQEAQEAIDIDLRRVLEQMKKSLEHAHGGGRVHQVRWMCPRLRTAIRDTKLLTDAERTNWLLKINELCKGYKDISEADRVALDLLQSDCISALSEPKATALFTSSIQNTLERGSGSLQRLGDILPPFHRLAKLGNPNLFSLLEQEAASGKTLEKDFIGQTLLHAAAANGHDALIEHLIYLRGRYAGFHVDIEERDHAGRTAVYLAISHGQWSTYRCLRDHKASLRVRSIAGHSPLAMAARGNHVAIVEDLIVNKSCPVNEKVLHAMGGCPPLHIAAERGHWDVVRVLLRHGADKDFCRMGDGKTPADLARSSGHSNLADYIDKGG